MRAPVLDVVFDYLAIRYRRALGPWWAVFGSYWVLLIGAWLLEHVLLKRIRKIEDPTGGARRDRGYVWMWILQFVLLQFPLYRMGRWATIFPKSWVVVGIGIGIAVTGMLIRLYSIYYLRGNFSYVVNVGEGHRLVTTGPYRHVRHPAYLGLLIYFFGLPLVLCDSYSMLLLMAYVGVLVYRRIRKEDAALRERFGEEYDAYRKRTRALIPFLF